MFCLTLEFWVRQGLGIAPRASAHWCTEVEWPQTVVTTACAHRRIPRVGQTFEGSPAAEWIYDLSLLHKFLLKDPQRNPFGWGSLMILRSKCLWRHNFPVLLGFREARNETQCPLDFLPACLHLNGLITVNVPNISKNKGSPAFPIHLAQQVVCKRSGRKLRGALRTLLGLIQESFLGCVGGGLVFLGCFPSRNPPKLRRIFTWPVARRELRAAVKEAPPGLSVVKVQGRLELEALRFADRQVFEPLVFSKLKTPPSASFLVGFSVEKPPAFCFLFLDRFPLLVRLDEVWTERGSAGSEVFICFPRFWRIFSQGLCPGPTRACNTNPTNLGGV